jgi:hypothetical protein
LYFEVEYELIVDQVAENFDETNNLTSSKKGKRPVANEKQKRVIELNKSKLEGNHYYNDQKQKRSKINNDINDERRSHRLAVKNTRSKYNIILLLIIF